MKQKATIIVEKASDGGYSCYVEEDFANFGLSGYGDSAKAAIEDLATSYNEISEILKEEGKEVPELSFTYKYDIQSFFNFFSYLNISKIGELAGINPSLLRQYATGVAKAGPRQYKKISNAVSHIIKDLSVAQF